MHQVSVHLQWLGSFIIVCVCFYKYSSRPVLIKTLGFYGLNSCFFQLLQQIAGAYFGNKGLNEIGDVYVLTETILLGVLFCLVITDKKMVVILSIAIVVYIIYYTLIMLFVDVNFYSLIRIGRDAMLIIFAILYFYFMMRDLPEQNLLSLPMFWISASVLFFFSGTFILSLFMDYLTKISSETMGRLWTFRNFFRLALCVGLIYAGLLDLKNMNTQKDRD